MDGRDISVHASAGFAHFPHSRVSFKKKREVCSSHGRRTDGMKIVPLAAVNPGA